MKLLMIDNYDSFTYNIVQYFGELGAEVEVFRNDEITVEGIARAVRTAWCVARPLFAQWKPVFRWRPFSTSCRQAAHSGRVPGAPEHRCGAGRQDRARAATDARQDQRHHHHAKGRVQPACPRSSR
jgi:hypothetical protein